MGGQVATEPITPDPPRRVRVPLLRQSWLDVVFLHWETDPVTARDRLPAGVDLDLFDGRAYVGLVALTMDVALGGAPLPFVDSFPELNVRLYTVDRHGRRGIAFCSMDAGRLLPAVAGRWGYGLPYRRADAAVSRRGPTVSYDLRRRWPGEDHPRSRFTVRVGDRLDRPGPLEDFLTARWVLHWSAARRSWWCPVDHPRWALHRATLESLDDQLVDDAGLPVSGGPVSVLYSPGTRSRIGAPRSR
jgi:uncharacterized protein YqjF (DUF2071 family)